MADPAHGRLGELYWSTDGVTYTKLGGLIDGSFGFALEQIEVTDHDSPGLSKEYIPGRYTVTIDAQLNYEEGDAGQDAIHTSYLNATTLYFRFRPKGSGTGLSQFATQGVVTSATIATPNADKSTFSLSITGTGAVTRAAQ